MASGERRYLKLAKLGEGTYATVFLARERATGRHVAIKKIKVNSKTSWNGLDNSSIREIGTLQRLKRHPNVIELIEVYTSGQNLNLVLEFLVTDLEVVIKDRSLIFSPADVKSWMVMLCRGCDWLHRHDILHRDLKPNNLLISHNGQLKIADFGLAREEASPKRKMSNQVVTIWYRAPELLWGARHYSIGVDIWSVGCIFAELMLRTPYLPGQGDIDQLDIIFRALGSPTESDWPGHTALPNYFRPKAYPKQDLSSLFTAAAKPAIQLLSHCLAWDPVKRPSARQLLDLEYFHAQPRPTEPSRLPRPKMTSQSTATVDAQKNGKKRSALEEEGQDGLKKVARKLDFS